MSLQIIPLIFALPLFGFWIWLFLDMTENQYLTKEAKNNWFLMFILLNVIGGFWYYLVEYRSRHS